MRTAVIVTTYNSPDWLGKVLWGFAYQTYGDFDLIVADDGSGPETAQRIESLRAQTGLRLTHVWQPDEGFQKTRILNKAIAAARADYLIFTDGDCIPRRDFVAVHVRNAEPGHFLSGGYFKLPMVSSLAIGPDDIAMGRAFDPDWLSDHGVQRSRKLWKLHARGTWARILNATTPTSPTWNGHNASGWKSDIVAANGFDERMQWGGLDRELGERLVNGRIYGKQIRYSAICVHLDHSRGYRNDESLALNRDIRRRTRSQRLTWTDFGLVKQRQPAVLPTLLPAGARS